MGKIGDAFTQPDPTIGEPGPGYGTDINAIFDETKIRLSQPVDGLSINCSTGGEFAHVIRTKQVAPARGQASGATWTKGTGAASGRWTSGAATDTVEMDLECERNQRLRAVRISAKSTGVAWTARVWAVDITTGVRTQVGTTLTSGVLTSIERLSIPGWPGVPPTVLQDIHYVLEWSAGAAAQLLIGAEWDYDRVVNT